MKSGANFSECGNYRYSLWRIWDESKPLVMFIGLNPSTANQTKNDPTIRRVMSMAQSWGYGGVYMMNCYAFVTPYPKNLHKGNIEINMLELGKIKPLVEEVIFAWGNFKEAESQLPLMKSMFPNAKALVINKNGSPKHPLYVKGDTIPVPFTPHPTNQR